VAKNSYEYTGSVAFMGKRLVLSVSAQMSVWGECLHQTGQMVGPLFTLFGLTIFRSIKQGKCIKGLFANMYEPSLIKS
jgi:hypothetical protein